MGARVGAVLGAKLGAAVGERVGTRVGALVGKVVGSVVGSAVGGSVGASVGPCAHSQLISVTSPPGLMFPLSAVLSVSPLYEPSAISLPFTVIAPGGLMLPATSIWPYSITSPCGVKPPSMTKKMFHARASFSSVIAVGFVLSEFTLPLNCRM